MNKVSQNNQGTMGGLSEIQKQIEEMIRQGIQVPDNIKLIQNPALQLAELQKINDEAKVVSNAAGELDQQTQKAVSKQQGEIDQMKNIQTGIIAKSKPFNLKKAQIDALDQFASQNTVEPSQNNQQSNISKLQGMKFNGVEEFVKGYLDKVDEINARNDILMAVSSAENVDSSIGEKVKEGLSIYYKAIGAKKDMSLNEKANLADHFYNLLPSEMKIGPSDRAEEGIIPNANYKEEITAKIKDTEESIKKLAKSNLPKSSFNLNKQAQAKTAENIIMYGPSEKRFDPFLRQPVSDWHIVERNKGYGFVVDDVFNIDWESIWRGNIMDKYSRPYRDSKTGEWVGGYIQKRFEVDKWIPEGNNYQLKPGELRRPYNASQGSLEARMEEQRKAASKDLGYEPTSEPETTKWDENELSETKVAKSFNLNKFSSKCDTCSTSKKKT